MDEEGDLAYLEPLPGHGDQERAESVEVELVVQRLHRLEEGIHVEDAPVQLGRESDVFRRVAWDESIGEVGQGQRRDLRSRRSGDLRILNRGLRPG